MSRNPSHKLFGRRGADRNSIVVDSGMTFGPVKEHNREWTFVVDNTHNYLVRGAIFGDAMKAFRKDHPNANVTRVTDHTSGQIYDAGGHRKN